MSQQSETRSTKKPRFSRERLKEVRTKTTVPALERNGQPIPASTSQRMFWFLSHVEKAGSAYILQSAIELRGPIDQGLLAKAFKSLSERQEGLRTCFEMTEGQLTLKIADPTTEFPLNYATATNDQARAQLIENEIAKPMDLTSGPLAKASLVSISPVDHILLILVHHAVADRTSFGILLNELSATYTAFVEGKPAPVFDHGSSYADFAAWEQAKRKQTGLRSEKAFWREYLKDCPALSTPAKMNQRGSIADHSGATFDFFIDENTSKTLLEFSDNVGVTPFITILAAWALFLHSTVDQDDIVTSAPVSFRDLPELTRTIGPFVNSLALRFQRGQATSADQFVHEVQRTFLDAQSHQTLPVDEVIEIVAPERSAAHSPLFQTMLSWNAGEQNGELAFGSTTAKMQDLEGHTAQLDLTLDIIQKEADLSAQFEYSKSLFKPSEIHNFAEQFRTILENLIKLENGEYANVEPTNFGDPSVLRGSRQAPQHLNMVHHLIEQVAKNNPDKIAISDAESRADYAEIDQRANHLAHQLVANGVLPGDHVVISLPRSLEMFVAALAILKAGAAFVPLDPDYPQSRKDFVLTDSGAKAIIVSDELQTSIAGVRSVSYGKANRDRAETTPQIDMSEDPAQLPAYVIYTSGSTGQPKGVVVSHCAIGAMVENWRDDFGFSAKSIILQMASFAFDVAVADFMRGLCFGGQLVICPKDALSDQTTLVELIKKHNINTADFVPAVLDPLTSDEHVAKDLFAAFNLIICGSDTWSVANAKRLVAACPPSCRVLHAYGLTETVVDALYLDVATLDENKGTLPLGLPVGNGYVEICDKEMQPVAVGSEGEICIGGPCLADEYLGQPDLTDQKFVRHADGRTIFKTGDIGRLNLDGHIELFGRSDKQIKIRGYRIDPREIENRLVSLGADQALVVKHDNRLIAYVTGIAKHNSVRAELAELVPSFTLPSQIIAIEVFPLTTNGKFDQESLPEPTSDVGFMPPEGELEIALSHIWSELLEHAQVGRHDDFFELGGHSMLAVRMSIAASKLLGRDIDSSGIFSHPTLGDFAKWVGQSVANQTVLKKRKRVSLLPASFGQEALWYLAQDEQQNIAYNMPLAWRLGQDINQTALLKALHEMVVRHEAFRTSFVIEDGQPALEICETRMEMPIRTISVSANELAAEAKREFASAFDLAHAPLIRTCYAKVDDGNDALFITMHHIISDGWSVDIFNNELRQIYSDFANGQDSSLPSLDFQFSDFVQWQRDTFGDETLIKQADYWSEQLKDSPALLPLPTDFPRPAVQDFVGDRVPVNIDTDLLENMRRFAQQNGTTVFNIAFSAWNYMLAKLSGEIDIVTGVPTANRKPKETENIIGFFVNTLAIRIDQNDIETPRELIAHVKQKMDKAFENQDLPFNKVVERVNPARSRSYNPIFQTMLAWENARGTVITDAENSSDFSNFPTAQHNSKFDLLLEIAEFDTRVSGSLQFATSLFSAQTAEKFCKYFQHIIHAFVASPDAALSGIGLVPRDQALKDQMRWVKPIEKIAPEDRTLARFSAVCSQFPDRLALEKQGASLSFADLDALSNQLALDLRHNGIKQGHLVGILGDRSIEAIVALLATIKIGAIALPLEPSHPKERINFILEDAQAAIVLAHAPSQVSEMGITPSLIFDIDLKGLKSRHSGKTVVAEFGSKQAAYALYTSGTTGRPKGVVQTHRMLDNLVNWQLAQGPIPERVLQFASMTFDVSFQEIFSSLCGGSTLILISRETAQDVSDLAKLISDQNIGRAFLPVAVLQIIGETNHLQNTCAKCEIITAGEALVISDRMRADLQKMALKKLHNHYGPTETHVATQHSLAGEHIEQWPLIPPIGRPVANTNLYVLDSRKQPVPDGVVGELYIAGTNVASGYLNQPELTAARFLNDPYSEDANAKIFKSGDLVRRRPDGVIDYIGRIDDQIKIRGFRVEPREIENVLAKHPDVDECIVIAKRRPSGMFALVVYFTGGPALNDLKAYLKKLVPDYMIPSEWISLDNFPLNTSGKVDRRALPDPKWKQSTANHAQLKTPTEMVLGDIWSTVLGLNKVGANDDFFNVGGHSLLAAKLIFRINRAFDAEFRLSDLIANPVLSDLARYIDSEANNNEAIEQITIQADPKNRFEPFPLGDIQEAYLVGRDADLGLGGVGAHSYNELRVRALDIDRFEAALNKVVERHDMLRAIFTDDGQQQVLQQVERYQITRNDLSKLADPAKEIEFSKVRDRMSHHVFDAGNWPLFAFEVTQLDEEFFHLHMGLDALILDAASTSILLSELLQFYAQPDLELPAIDVTFRDYTLAERELRKSGAYAQDLNYWLERFDDMPSGPKLPLARTPESLGLPKFVRREKTLDQGLWNKIKDIANGHQITPSGVLLTAFCQVLNRYAHSDKFSLSLPMFNRLPLHEDIDRVIGDFTSVLLFQAGTSGGSSFVEYGQFIQKELWRDLDHAKISGIEIIRELGRRFGVQPAGLPIVFNSTLTEMVQNDDARAPADAFDAENVHTITQTPQVWLDHTIMEERGELIFNWDSIDALFPAGFMDQMFDDYLALLHALTEPRAWQRTVPQLLNVEAIAPADEISDLKTLDQLFVRQVQHTPDNLAIISKERSLSYAALLQESEAMAAELQDAGCQPDDIVALFLEPSWRQAVGVIGTLLAGAAYLPLDPALPAERIRQILAKTSAKFVIVKEGFNEIKKLPEGITLIEVREQPSLRVPVKVSRSVTDLAYVIFTSGSTGEPKGVMIDHGGACNTIFDINERMELSEDDRILGVSALNFDLSVYDIFGPLSTGAALVVPDAEQNRDPRHWLDTIKEFDVTVWNSVPALVGLLADEAKASNAEIDLRIVMMSGDWIPLDLPDRIRSCCRGVKLWSLGGATEASIWSIAYPIEEIDPSWKSIPYGQAINGQSFYVLDNQLVQKPEWVVGELYIGGRGVALGYFGDPERTKASFIKHPQTGQVLYRTGDLGRLLPDGNIEFMGRTDTQVKIQGYRIELGEVEATLNRHPQIETAAARVWGNTMQEKRLAAYVVSTTDKLTENAIRDHLAQILPAYEIPSTISFVPEIPLSANGKVDRNRLPAPELGNQQTEDFTFKSDDERKIAQIAENVLDISPLPARANLLSLGASSLDIVRISNAMAAEMGFRPNLARFMRSPSVATLIEFWHEHQESNASIPKAPEPNQDVVLENAEDRANFKAAQKGRRRFDNNAKRLPLDIAASSDSLDRFEANRSAREFLDTCISKSQFSQLLSCLMQNTNEGRPRFQYASAGGLYPVQTYVFVKAERIETMAEGCYYFDPSDRTLVSVGDGRSLSSDAYDYFVNRPTFESAAFAVFFVCDEAAIKPMYGESSRNMALIETGQIAQHLTNKAGELGLGLCGIGDIASETLCTLFDLSPQHSLTYSMVGGIPASHVESIQSSVKVEEFEI